LLHPVTGEHLGMREAVRQCINEAESTNKDVLIEHMANIFGTALYERKVKGKAVPLASPVKTSIDEQEANAFIIEIKRLHENRKGNSHES
jgi:hypothetical protein